VETRKGTGSKGSRTTGRSMRQGYNLCLRHSNHYGLALPLPLPLSLPLSPPFPLTFPPVGSFWSLLLLSTAMGPSVPIAQPTAVSELHPFRKLPTDLRLKIWEALVEPRVVPIIVTDIRVCSICPAPVILHICYESRQIGLRYYEPTIRFFHYQYTNSCVKDYRETLIYFKPSTGILYLSSRYTLLKQFDLALCRFQSATHAIDHWTFCQHIHPVSTDSGQVMFWDKSKRALPKRVLL
jgi:hypothetical protein